MQVIEMPSTKMCESTYLLTAKTNITSIVSSHIDMHTHAGSTLHNSVTYDPLTLESMHAKSCHTELWGVEIWLISLHRPMAYITAILPLWCWQLK